MKKQEQKDLIPVWVVSSTENPLNYLVSHYSVGWHNVKYVSVLS